MQECTEKKGIFEEVIIIGSGPAALTAAIYTSRAGLTPLLFEGELNGGNLCPGGQLMQTTEVENYPGFPKAIDGDHLIQSLKDQAVKFGTRIVSKFIVCINVKDGKAVHEVIDTEGQSYQAKALIIATGAQAKYLGLPSEEKFLNRGVSACATCDGALPRFRNKPVVVVGGGDTAMEEALFLSKFASVVYIIHRRDTFRASRIMVDRVLSNPKIQVKWNSTVVEILGDDKFGLTGVLIKSNEKVGDELLDCRGYFCAIGHKPNTGFLKGVLEMDENGYLLVSKPGRTFTKVPGVFVAGDVADPIYRQAITAAGSGCMAAIDCTRWLEEQ